MKRILILCLSLFTLFGWSQNLNSTSKLVKSNPAKKADVMQMVVDQVSTQGIVKVPKAPDAAKSIQAVNYKYTWEKIGMTNYGLQTNSSIARRVKLYPSGNVSAVWTTSPDGNPWTTRGSGYNYYDGSNWFPTVESRLELQRTGWPNITSYDNGTKEVEYVVSHYAEAAGGSGGYSINNNDGVGSTTWSEFAKDKGSGPIWARTATSSDYLYIIGNYTDTLVVKAGVKRPMVFTRYNMKTDKWGDQITLPGYDKSVFSYGNGDNYSIDARDNVVSIVAGSAGGRVAMWRSDDYGDTWGKIIVDNFSWPEPAFSGDTIVFYYNDGSMNVIIDKNYTSHVFYGTSHGWDLEPGDGLYYPLRTRSQIAYFNDKYELDSSLVNDTIFKDTIVYRLWVDGKVAQAVVYMLDTSWNYTFNTADTTISATAKKSFSVTLYDDKDNPFTGQTMTVWPSYYTYKFDTATGNPTDSTLVPPDKIVTLDSFVVEIVDQIVSHYQTFKVYPNKGLISTTAILDEDGDGVVTLNPQTWNKDEQNNDYLQGGRYGNTANVTMPIACIDNDGYIYLIYSAPMEVAVAPVNNENFRDVYVVYSKDGGATWSETQNLTKNPYMEDVFASVAKDVDDNLHIIFQEDEEPGTEVQNGDDPTLNDIYYVAIPKADILNNTIGPNTRPAGISENNISVDMHLYPNPATESTRISMDLPQSTQITLTVYNVLGETVLTQNYNLNPGISQISLDLTSFQKGMYMLNIKGDKINSVSNLLVQ